MRLIDTDELENRPIFIDDDEWEDTFDDGLLFVCDLIDNSPTVDAVPVRHGWWIDVNYDGSLWRCSICGETQCCKSNYCGDCGAKMDGEPREEKQNDYFSSDENRA